MNPAEPATSIIIENRKNIGYCTLLGPPSSHVHTHANRASPLVLSAVNQKSALLLSKSRFREPFNLHLYESVQIY